MYSPLSNIVRSATANYPVPNTDVTIKEGTLVFIPVHAIHHDPEYYPEPDRFDPERFSPEQINQRHNMTHLPFGEGPRNCIGLRFGKMQTKIGLIMLLKNFEFKLCSKSIVPLVISEQNIILKSKGGLYLSVTKIEIGLYLHK